MNESALNANVGYRVRSLRLSRNIKQADAARELGVSAAYLNLIEKGKRVMPFPLLWKALRYFEQDPEQFMSSLGQGRADEALAKLLDDRVIGKNVGRAFAVDQLPDAVTHRFRRMRFAAVGRRDRRREEVFSRTGSGADGSGPVLSVDGRSAIGEG